MQQKKEKICVCLYIKLKFLKWRSYFRNLNIKVKSVKIELTHSHLLNASYAPTILSRVQEP